MKESYRWFSPFWSTLAMNTFNVALSGLNAASLRLANSANNIANVNTTGRIVDGVRVGRYTPTDVVQSAVEPQGGVNASVVARNPQAVNLSSPTNTDPDSRDNILTFPNVSLEEEVVNSDIATYTFKANLKSLKALDEMLGAVLDIAV
jgi:flagellar basal body rod protein FlgC